jgi:cytochrome c
LKTAIIKRSRIEALDVRTQLALRVLQSLGTLHWLCALGLALSAACAANKASAAGPTPQELAKERHCLSCHAVDHKVVGPAYADVAKKYQQDPTALARLAQKIRLGGGGIWGAVPMPANAQVSADEAQVLAQWILKLPAPP